MYRYGATSVEWTYRQDHDGNDNGHREDYRQTYYQPLIYQFCSVPKIPLPNLRSERWGDSFYDRRYACSPFTETKYSTPPNSESNSESSPETQFPIHYFVMPQKEVVSDTDWEIDCDVYATATGFESPLLQGGAWSSQKRRLTPWFLAKGMNPSLHCTDHCPSCSILPSRCTFHPAKPFYISAPTVVPVQLLAAPDLARFAPPKEGLFSKILDTVSYGATVAGVFGAGLEALPAMNALAEAANQVISAVKDTNDQLTTVAAPFLVEEGSGYVAMGKQIEDWTTAMVNQVQLRIDSELAGETRTMYQLEVKDQLKFFA